MFVVRDVQRQGAGTYRGLAQQVKSSLWLIAFYALIILFSWLGSFGGLNVVVTWDTVLVAAMSLGIYYWGARIRYLELILLGDEESGRTVWSR